MFCFWNGFCLCLSTVLAGVGFYSLFLAGRCFGHFSIIPRMSSGRNRLYICFITVCIGTIIRLFSVFCTSSFLCNRTMIPMVGCSWNLFCLCFATCLTCISLNAFLGFCCFFCNHSVIPCVTKLFDHRTCF